MEQSTSTLFWKIYFWLYLASQVLAYLAHEFWRVWETFDVLFTSCALVGLFAFAWGRMVFTLSFWRIFLPIFILWSGYYLYLLPLPMEVLEKYPLSQFALVTPTLLFALPLFAGLYFFAFTSHNEDEKQTII